MQRQTRSRQTADHFRARTRQHEPPHGLRRTDHHRRLPAPAARPAGGTRPGRTRAATGNRSVDAATGRAGSTRHIAAVPGDRRRGARAERRPRPRRTARLAHASHRPWQPGLRDDGLGDARRCLVPGAALHAAAAGQRRNQPAARGRAGDPAPAARPCAPAGAAPVLQRSPADRPVSLRRLAARRTGPGRQARLRLPEPAVPVPLPQCRYDQAHVQLVFPPSCSPARYRWPIRLRCAAPANTASANWRCSMPAAGTSAPACGWSWNARNSASQPGGSSRAPAPVQPQPQAASA